MPLPLIIALDAVHKALNDADAPTTVNLTDNQRLHIIDVRPHTQYLQGHLPGAISLQPALLSRKDPPVGGLLPDIAAVSPIIRNLGIHWGDHIVAYDAGMQTAAARLVWVLHAYGITTVSWMDGGLAAWQAAGLPIESANVIPATSSIGVSRRAHNVITTDELLNTLGRSDLAIIDARSLNEYAGSDVRSLFGGHIPTAVHMDWIELFNARGLLKDDSELRQILLKLGITPTKQVVVYCQTHQRSSVTYLVLKHLGYERVLGLDGAWSSWGNRHDTPKQQV